MRLSHIEARLEQQLELMHIIINSFNELTKIGQQNLSSQRLQARLTILKEDWERFSIVHDAISISIRALSSEDKIAINNHSYFTDNCYSITRELYVESLERISALSDSENRSLRATSLNPSFSSSFPQSNMPTCSYQSRIPRLDIPKFNGTTSEWLPFKELFSSIIISNQSLPLVEKLHYLKTSLIGSAANLLKNTSLVADNFQKAWDSLIAFYENKRELVNAALESLVNVKKMTRESAQEMEHLYHKFIQIHRTLETLQRPVSHWDDFFVFMAVQRLDSESVKAWEQHLGSSMEPPTWSQFLEFLLARLRTYKNCEKAKSGGSRVKENSFAAKTHFQGKGKEINSTKSKSCVFCSENHAIHLCPQYSAKSVKNKLSLILKYKLCYNCLGPHRISSCRSTFRCLKCGRKHHTSIHREVTHTNEEKTENKENVKTSSSEMNSEANHSKVLHSTTELSFSVPCVLLATAQVNLIASNGNLTEDRALIDPGSELSLITERVAQRLKLARNSSSIPLVGVGGQSSNKTRGKVNFTLQPHFDSNFSSLISAHVLPKLTTSIPSTRVESSSWTHLNGLQLADPKYNVPGAIDIILGADVYGLILNKGIHKGPVGAPIAQQTHLGWVILGQTNSSLIEDKARSYHVSINEELYQLLHRFWELEKIPVYFNSSLSAEEQDCENQFQSGFSRDQQGRYVVKLPFKQSPEKLGDSKKRLFALLLIYLTNLR